MQPTHGGATIMLAFCNEPLNAGPKSARMEQRTTQSTKDIIELAASLLGVNASEFTVVAAAKAARDTLRDYESTPLRREDHEAFMRAFDDVEPSSALLDLMKLHSEVVSSK